MTHSIAQRFDEGRWPGDGRAYLVTGARGIVGRAVIDQLLAAGKSVRAASSDPAKSTVPDGVDVVAYDQTDPKSVAAALDGIERVFLYAEPEGIENFISAAASVGVEQVVLLSSIAAESGDNPIGAKHLAVERPLQDSGLALTILRPGAFAANARGWISSIKSERVVRLPFPDLQLNPIHEADMAAAAVTALTEPGHAGKIYPLTGPESLSQRAMVDAIAAAIGAPIELVELTYEQAAEFMFKPVLDMWATLGTTPAHIGPTAESVTGRAPRTYTQWAADHANDFR
ncbi:NAD(P)H-binding protein [Nocardia sp. NBC_00565]|uniref:SDR family oxidoreductase n=1 Tax=Nocardia sp. NBC_00565 TaxID=2975993 RepID=UPI002E808774|nr:NAD(P)H-binding protein [Nocardia sp. NBC_00565]WUC02266.1 NAD(P)H-binding protein [Nocardia sp. NBC_00565]